MDELELFLTVAAANQSPTVAPIRMATPKAREKVTVALTKESCTTQTDVYTFYNATLPDFCKSGPFHTETQKTTFVICSLLF